LASPNAVTAESENSVTTATKPASVNYESMALKELQALAKTRGITGAGSMKKNPLIEALRTSDKVEPGTNGTNASSFLDTSGAFLSLPA
jgi:hypothetical protein